MSNQAPPLSIKQAAARLHLHPRKVTRLVIAGTLHGVKAFDGLRAPWLIDGAEVERYARRFGGAA